MMEKSALVTGGAGFIGSHLVDKLVEQGWFVRVIDNLSSGRLENLSKYIDASEHNVEVIIGDLKNKIDCIKAIEDINIVFHFAANPEVRVSTISPETHFNENVLTTFNLLEAIRQKGNVQYFVFASSSSVYGEPKEIPVDELAPLRPVSVYGASKASCESLIHAYSVLYGIRSICLRYANIVGSRLRHGVVYDFIKKLNKNPHVLEILGDGNQIRSYLFIDDAINATIESLESFSANNNFFEVYNVGNDDFISVNDVARIVTTSLGLTNVKFVYKPVAHGVGWLGDVKRIALNINKIKKLGWKPKLTSHEAIKETVLALMNEIM